MWWMKGQADGDANKKIIVGRIAVRRMGASCTAMEIYVSGTVGSYDTSHEYCIFVPPDLRPYPVQISPQSLWVCSVSLCLCGEWSSEGVIYGGDDLHERRPGVRSRVRRAHRASPYIKSPYITIAKTIKRCAWRTLLDCHRFFYMTAMAKILLRLHRFHQHFIHHPGLQPAAYFTGDLRIIFCRLFTDIGKAHACTQLRQRLRFCCAQ